MTEEGLARSGPRPTSIRDLAAWIPFILSDFPPITLSRQADPFFDIRSDRARHAVRRLPLASSICQLLCVCPDV